MPLNFARARRCLEAGDLQSLFIDELGWDLPALKSLEIEDQTTTYTLRGIARTETGRADVWLCTVAENTFPDHATKLRIEARLSELSVEHVTIFATPDVKRQAWVWVRRKTKTRPRAVRTHEYRQGQSADALLQKLQGLFLSIDYESGKVEGNEWLEHVFDIEPVTSKFYREFKAHRETFISHIAGITESNDRAWYASIMLNRLMFTWFIQKQGLLDSNPNYLTDKLVSIQETLGKDVFHSFYRSFLLRLFHDGLGRQESLRSPQSAALLGNIPFLNGGIFDIHSLEKQSRYGDIIQIPDRVFTDLFAFFSTYQWHIDDRPVTDGNEINPDVLGYIFEQFINQKDMGAYYTKEDVTEYIGRSTIIPFLVERTKRDCAEPFQGNESPSVWDLLVQDPDRYIFPPVRHGINVRLPSHIEVGVSPVDRSSRTARANWGQRVPIAADGKQSAALLGESWREVHARRERYTNLRAKICSRSIQQTNDLVTFNLNLRQFAQDLVERTNNPDLLWAFWRAISSITVLDPTGGSGAFLFAALNILEPLYEACLDRMEEFKVEWEDSNSVSFPKYAQQFEEALSAFSGHVNRRYIILKHIILHNLYSVDIMEEAAEICKLRLFLKLIAQAQPDVSAPNMGIEPLPDIDFNLGTGNALVGFATLDEVRLAISSTFDFTGSAEAIRNSLAKTALIYREFRDEQVRIDQSHAINVKIRLQQEVSQLREKLDLYLYEQTHSRSDVESLASWKASHRPFHWIVAFYEVIANGGFSVVIGNPPYIARSKIRDQYELRGFSTDRCGDIYACVTERSLSLTDPECGRIGVIVPLSLTFSREFTALRSLIFRKCATNWFASFGRIPAALFAADVRVRNTIYLGSPQKATQENYTTRLHRWNEEQRGTLLDLLQYSTFDHRVWDDGIPKVGTQGLADTLTQWRVRARAFPQTQPTRNGTHRLFFKGTAYNSIAFTPLPPPTLRGGQPITPPELGSVGFMAKSEADTYFLAMCGKLGFIWWLVTGDDFHVTKSTIERFPLTADMRNTYTEMQRYCSILEESLPSALQWKANAGLMVGSYNTARIRDITDEIDVMMLEYIGASHIWEEIELYVNNTMRTDFSGDIE